jgi:RNA polymerase sigma-70 factor (ECF subfamily)
MSQDFHPGYRYGKADGLSEAGLSDEQLMAKVQRGDGNAFTLLFDRYNRLVLTVALRIVHDVAEAQEVTQDVFFEFYRSAARFDPARGKLKVWLLQFAYHRSINRRNYLLLRQFYSRQNLDEVMAWETAGETSPRTPAQEIKQVVQQALSTLSETQRSVVEQVIFEGLTLREVADRSRMNYFTMRNQYYKALDQLRASLLPKVEALPIVDILGEISHGEA